MYKQKIAIKTDSMAYFNPIKEMINSIKSHHNGSKNRPQYNFIVL
jgi:hypothetical protein